MIHIKRNDTRPVATATIKRGGVPVSLDDAINVTFKMRHETLTDLKVNALGVITDAPNGEVEYRWLVGDTSLTGRFFAEWEVLWNDGTIETFPTLSHDFVFVWSDLDGGKI